MCLELYPLLEPLVESKGFSLEHFADYINANADVKNFDTIRDQLKDKIISGITNDTGTYDVELDAIVGVNAQFDEDYVGYEEILSYLDTFTNEELELVKPVILNYDFENGSIEDFRKKINIAAGKLSKEEQFETLRSSLGGSIFNQLSEDAKAAYEDYKQAIEEYKQLINELNELEVNPDQSIFGNIDLNNRQVLQWNRDNLELYRSALRSWGFNPNEFKDTISTVLGGSENFDGLEIAFSPILQTENGAVLLDKNTLISYINSLIASLSSSGNEWSTEDLLALDAQGIETNGIVIKNVIADVGETAIATGEAMHYLGKDGAIAGAMDNVNNAFEEVGKEAEKAKVSTDEFLNAFENNEVQQWFDALSEEDKQLVYEISLRANDTSLWTIREWKKEIANLKNGALLSSEQMKEFETFMNDTNDAEGFSSTINNYTEGLSKLEEVLSKIKTTGLTDEDKLSLALEYPDLAPYVNDTDALSKAIKNLINTSNQGINKQIEDQITAWSETAPLAAEALEHLQNILMSFQNGFSVDIDDEITSFNNLYSAMKESVSGTGLSNDSIANIKAMFSGLDTSGLFEYTEHGVHLNIKSLRELQSEYEKTTKDAINADLGYWLNEQVNPSGNFSNDFIDSQIEKALELRSQYEGLTSSYNKWQTALSSGEEGDMYDTARDWKDDAQSLYEQGLIGTNAFREYVDMLSFKDLSNPDDWDKFSIAEEWKKLNKAIEGTSYSAIDFLEDGHKGAENFLKALKDVSKENEDIIKQNKDGSWEINNGDYTDKYISEMLGIDKEFYQMLLRKLSEYDFDVTINSNFEEEAQSFAEKARIAAERVKNSGFEEKYNIELDVDYSEATVKDLQTQIEELENAKLKVDINTEEGRRELDLIDQMIAALNKQIVSISIQTKLDEGETATELLKLTDSKLIAKLGIDYSELETAKAVLEQYRNQEYKVSIKTYLEENPDVSIEEILEMEDEEITKTFNIEGEEELNSFKESIQEIKDGGDTPITVRLDDAQFSALTSQEDVTVTATVDQDAVITAINGVKAQVAAATAEIQIGAEKDPVKIGMVLSGINEQVNAANIEVPIGAKIDTQSVSEIADFKQSIDEIEDKIVGVEAEVVGTDEVNELYKAIDRLPNDKDVKIDAVVDGIRDVDTLISKINNLPNQKTINITTKEEVVTTGGSGGSNKKFETTTATMVNGTAYARGNWSTKDSGVALGGELGQEIVVRNGHFFTIGDNGAEFFEYRKNDIIFNAEQSRQLLENGKITSGARRGKAFAKGTDDLKRGSTGLGKLPTITSGSSGSGSGNSNSSSDGGSSSSGGGSSSGSTEEAEEFKETLDWIEIAIDRIERAISNLDLKANNVYKKWSDRNDALKEEIKEVRSEIGLQQLAYERYLTEANSVGLDESVAKLVRDGAIDIATIEDEDLANKISQYQEW